MSRSKWIILALALTVVAASALLIGCDAEAGGLIDSAKMQSLMADGVRVIDVRTTAEFEGGHIPGAENVPVSDLEQAAATWDKDQPVALYCATGSRSADAATMLGSLGFSTVYDLAGGIAQWDGDVESGEAAVVAAVPSASGLPVMYEFYTDW